MRIGTGIVLGVLLTLGAAGCGSPTGNSGVATATGRTSANGNASATSAIDPNGVKYAQCMRDHGVDMADPKPGGEISLNVSKGVDPHKVDAAAQACKKY